ncbi:unnamed protein product [Nippostrongylus brasiliensis]|uniref:CABIT domain-containing protein n=1 Tax=Nippostrongylus brasiliensis TaxID=27835 RepID=A0A0N4YEU6_NIPBR|nr:unnamed protein product [Nippostrongylus brasiliensis]
MKERVDLNGSGLCIESSGRILKNGKWVKRYVLCKKPCDVSAPIFYVYKSKKDRQQNNLKTSLLLQNYVGFESGTCFYMQLQKAPPREEFAPVLYKEVRCHLHDSRLAVVYGRPQKLLLYCDIHFSKITVERNNSITIQPSQSNSDVCFGFMCARSETFQRMLTKATREKGLHRYLSKKNSEGDWMPEFVVPKRAEQADTESQFSHTLSGLFNFFNIDTARSYKRMNLDKEKSKSGFYIGGGNASRAQHSNLARANSLAFYHNMRPPVTKDEPVVNYVNIGRHSVSKPILDRERGGSDRERMYASSRKVSRFEPAVTSYDNYQNKESIVQNKLAHTMHRKSLPNYINAQQLPYSKRGQAEDGKLFTRSPGHGYRRKSELALAQAMDKPSTRLGRSVGDLKAEESRYENWRRAKKFISSFKPKSQCDLNQKNKVYNEASISSDSLTDFDDPPPSLDLVVSEAAVLQKELEESPPEGLVRPKDDIQIKPRAGVSAVLARRLAASVTGSFSKYDGERATHHYQGGPALSAASPPMLEALDGIEAAVYRGQDRLKESDRRASSVSFHRVLPAPAKHPKQKKLSVGVDQKSVVHITSPRNSTSYSESTSSDVEFAYTITALLSSGYKYAVVTSNYRRAEGFRITATTE